MLDIEGTTTSIKFVKDVLFPFVRSHIHTYVHDHWAEPEFQEDVKQLRQQAQQDAVIDAVGVVQIPSNAEELEIKEKIVANVLWQMDGDRKTTALKQLQGHMWRDGYQTGQLVGHIYDDVPLALKRWSSGCSRIFIYSSGSVEAQKLLFGSTTHGNFLQFIAGHYDTKIGAKVKSDSYQRISEDIGCAAGDILFLTDIPKEAVAAKKAGLQVKLVVRPGNSPLTKEDTDDIDVITDFHQL